MEDHGLQQPNYQTILKADILDKVNDFLANGEEQNVPRPINYS